MKGSKCNRETDASAPQCPNCGLGTDGEQQVRCPECGSAQISAVRKTYDPGCGCLGLLIFGWWGMLLGLLGAGDVELVCNRCGARWPAGKPSDARNGLGCCGLLLLLLLIYLLCSLIFW